MELAWKRSSCALCCKQPARLTETKHTATAKTGGTGAGRPHKLGVGCFEGVDIYCSFKETLLFSISFSGTLFKLPQQRPSIWNLRKGLFRTAVPFKDAFGSDSICWGANLVHLLA